MSYKNPPPPKFSVNDSLLIGVQLKALSEYMGKYSISFQFWGDGNNNAFVEKDNIELYSGGGFDTPLEVVTNVLEYLDRINRKEREYNPNF